MVVEIIPLGAGQDVGRSCIIVKMGGRTIMLDCGAHVGSKPSERFPNFELLSSIAPQGLDAVVISHFHLDHIGALPVLTEHYGYKGPVIMTHPTRAIAKLLVADFSRVMTELRGEQGVYNEQEIGACFQKVISVDLKERVVVSGKDTVNVSVQGVHGINGNVGTNVVNVGSAATITTHTPHTPHSIHTPPDIEVRMFYAGHVLGAAMVYVRVGCESVLYTGDYSMVADRHLDGAAVERVYPDVLITESTYGTTVRAPRRQREHTFLKEVQNCVENGGKVLIPVFAVGRAQELCLLLETHWDRMNLKTPVYVTTGLVEDVTQYYKSFNHWMNEKVRHQFVERNLFDFKHIKIVDRSEIMSCEGPVVALATPGMLHGGTSFYIFTRWCSSPNNLVVMPGYCVKGTHGNAVLSGKKTVSDRNGTFHVRCRILSLSFSAHSDAKGIFRLIRAVQPKNVVLVHGEENKMQVLEAAITSEYGVPVFHPPNFQRVVCSTALCVPVRLPVGMVRGVGVGGRGSEGEGGGEGEGEGDGVDYAFDPPVPFASSVKMEMKYPINGLLSMRAGTERGTIGLGLRRTPQPQSPVSQISASSGKGKVGPTVIDLLGEGEGVGEGVETQTNLNGNHQTLSTTTATTAITTPSASALYEMPELDVVYSTGEEVVRCVGSVCSVGSVVEYGVCLEKVEEKEVCVDGVQIGKRKREDEGESAATLYIPYNAHDTHTHTHTPNTERLAYVMKAIVEKVRVGCGFEPSEGGGEGGGERECVGVMYTVNDTDIHVSVFNKKEKGKEKKEERAVCCVVRVEWSSDNAEEAVSRICKEIEKYRV